MSKKDQATDRSIKSPKRRTVLASGAAIMGSLAGCASSLGGGSSGPIKLGNLEDQSGILSVGGIPKHHAAQLAVKEINDNGGLLDREVEILAPDPESSNAKYKSLARKLILEDQVDVLVGAQTSSAREAIRPIIDENKQLYFYTNQYEGGLCDEYTFATGAVPEQQLAPLIPYMVENFGNRVYTLAADFNFGHISSLWAKRYAEEAGGKIVGEEFFPLSVGEFESTINDIQDKDPDWLFIALVGANHNNFYKQAQSVGLNKPMASGNVVALGGEHKSLAPPVLEGMHLGVNYLEELPSDRNSDFVQKFRDEFPDTRYIIQSAEVEYMAVKMWAKAVERAGTVDQAEVGSELERGISMSMPEGDVKLDPATHHVVRDIHLARVEKDHSISFLETFPDIGLSWLQERCQLDTDESTWDNPVTKQFIPGE